MSKHDRCNSGHRCSASSVVVTAAAAAGTVVAEAELRVEVREATVAPLAQRVAARRVAVWGVAATGARVVQACRRACHQHTLRGRTTGAGRSFQACRREGNPVRSCNLTTVHTSRYPCTQDHHGSAGAGAWVAVWAALVEGRVLSQSVQLSAPRWACGQPNGWSQCWRPRQSHPIRSKPPGASRARPARALRLQPLHQSRPEL
mmetsp:Transcript_34469/g.90675  ORF Transcript_34469/g.90675 Transcript_34469/m.90675 type:complete len:203 (+) Transcript_34469:302-910(+)